MDEKSFTLYFRYSRSERYSKALELAERAVSHEIIGTGINRVNRVIFNEDQVDLMAAVYSLTRPWLETMEEKTAIAQVEQKLLEEGYFEFKDLRSRKPIDLYNKPSSWVITPLKRPQIHESAEFADTRKLIAERRYEEAIKAYYQSLGDSFYFDGPLHYELIYLKRLAGLPLQGRDLLFFRPESTRNDLVKSNLGEYVACIDECFQERQVAGLPSPIQVILENAPTMEDLISQRESEIHSSVCLENGNTLRELKDTKPVTAERFSIAYDFCPRGVLFTKYPDQIRYCRITEAPSDERYAGLWTTLSPETHQKEVVEKGLHIAFIEAFTHILWGKKKRKPPFQEVGSEGEIKKHKYGTHGIRYTGRTHKIANKTCYEIDLLRKDANRAKDLGNVFFEIVFEVLRDAENRLRSNHHVPAIGEGWVSEMLIFELIKSRFPDAVHHASPKWIRPQHLDVFVPSCRVAFEYQGLQHFEAVEFFGGLESYEYGRERDVRKRKLCQKNGIKLVEWHYDEPITVEILNDKLADYGKISNNCPPCESGSPRITRKKEIGT